MIYDRRKRIIAMLQRDGIHWRPDGCGGKKTPAVLQLKSSGRYRLRLTKQ